MAPLVHEGASKRREVQKILYDEWVAEGDASAPAKSIDLAKREIGRQ